MFMSIFRERVLFGLTRPRNEYDLTLLCPGSFSAKSNFVCVFREGPRTPSDCSGPDFRCRHHDVGRHQGRSAEVSRRGGLLRGRMVWEESLNFGDFSFASHLRRRPSCLLCTCAKCKGCCLQSGCRACSCKHTFGQKFECVL